ncbi:MAG: LLM class F420-dependent oxidoreductase [Chloroflexi bacterium]|nr:LLM class F420-dependent oxidoreductase [Chloroflexota bacterium]
MKIGLFFGSGITAPTISALVDEVVKAEEEGFDSFWFAQILGPEVLSVIAMAGQRTKRIEMGTAVVPTFPRHPMVMAQEAMTAQSATNGRLTLGIGLSHKVTVEGAWGLSFDQLAKHMREYLTILHSLVHERAVDFTGDLFKVSGTIAVPGATPCPILLAALGPKMLKLAGEMADGTVTWMAGPQTLETHIIPRISEAAKEAGRPAPRISAGVAVAVTNKPDEVNNRLVGDLRVYGRLPSYRRLLDIERVLHPHDLAIVGDEKTVERELKQFAEIGASDLLVTPFPLGTDTLAKETQKRTREFIRTLVGRY